MGKIMSRIINIVFVLVFGFIILGGLFLKNRLYGSSNQLIIIASTLLWGVLLFVLFKKISKTKEISNKKKNIILACFFIIFFIIQLIVAKQLQVIPSWDFGNNYQAAKSFATNGDLYLNYVYPNNYFLTFCLAIVYKISSIFGYFDFETLSIIINIIFIDLSIFLIYLIAKKLIGTNYALFATFMCLFISAFLLYTPIFYTDTLSMFVPVLMFYIFININENNSKKKNILLLICLGVVTFIGYKLKGSTFVTIIAMFIIWLFQDSSIKEKIFKILIPTFIVIILMISYNIVLNIALPNLEKYEDHNLPITHYLMMGLNDEGLIYGGFSQTDFTNTSHSEDKVAYNLEVIKERISKRKIWGNIKFYAIKTLDTWADGTYFAPGKLNSKPINNSPLHAIVLPNGKYFDVCFNFYTGIVLAMYVFMFISCVVDLKNKTNLLDNKTLLRCVLLGIWLFLLIWETRSRYLVDFVPIMIVLTVLSLYSIVNFEKNKLTNKE